MHESELTIRFPNGARITLFGGDNAEALRGGYFDGIVIDEVAAASMAPANLTTDKCFQPTFTARKPGLSWRQAS